MLNPYEGGEFKVTSLYGTRTLNGSTAFHSGLDLVGVSSKNLLSICNGTVIQSQIISQSSGDITWQWGNYVMIKADTGERIIYAHLSKRLVSKGQRVKIGDVIGIEGDTGYSFGSHCHLEVRNSSNKVTATTNTPSYTGIPNIIQTIKNKGDEEPMTAAEKKAFEALTSKVEKLEKELAKKGNAEKVYHYFDELPEWAHDPIKALYKKGYFAGAAPDDLNLPESTARTLVVLARAMKEDGKFTY